MAPEIITELGLSIRYVDAVRRLPDGPPWWISGHQLLGRPPTVAERMLDQLVDAEPEREFFNQGGDGWRAFVDRLHTQPGSGVEVTLLARPGKGVGEVGHDNLPVTDE